ncbi:MAG: hypothetical protein KA004_04875 [Verrucomicrobiales bacterium]|nr:hypothetical protein [Verrucomicrobiales bacterium]
MSHTTLIHLVSGERMQNLLPLLALKPRTVFQLCSDSPAILAAAEHTAAAARQAGIEADFRIEKLPGATPTTQDVRHAHKQLLSVFPGAVVNITGGTKLMSLGAYLGANEFHDSPILYCDTANRTFVQVGEAPLPPHMKSFPEVASLLTVPVVMAAQGKPFREDAITPDLLAFGSAAWDLRSRDHESIAAWTSRIRSAVPRKNGRVEKSKPLLRRFLATPLPFPESPAAIDYLDAAVAAGLLAVDPAGAVRMIADPKPSSVERVSNLLDGAWLELAVAAMAGNATRYGDLHWSVQPPDQTGADYGETDLIAVDRQKLNLAVISCKTSTQHVSTLEHLSSWRDRARTLGGSHAAGHLCLFRAKSSDEAARLHAMGRTMGLHVHISAEIPAHFAATS